MSSFFIRGLARMFAASAMEHRERRAASYTTQFSQTEEEKPLTPSCLSSWQTEMLWIIPFVQATDYTVVISNPKSHEQIIIEPTTQELPPLTLEWLQRYDEKEFLEKIEQEKIQQQQQQQDKIRIEEAARIARLKGQSRFGNNYEPTKDEIQEVLRDL